jgi:hypothetical protein
MSASVIPVAFRRLLCGALSIPFLIRSDLIAPPVLRFVVEVAQIDEDPRVAPGVCCGLRLSLAFSPQRPREVQ